MCSSKASDLKPRIRNVTMDIDPFQLNGAHHISYSGVVLSAACVAAGRAMSSTSLIHAVLRVEQLMTAGIYEPIERRQSRIIIQCLPVLEYLLPW